DLPRRLARLGHIAFFGLGIINVLVAYELPRLPLGRLAVRTASVTMNIGNLFLPAALFAAPARRPPKYSMPVPALCGFLPVAIVAYGACCRSEAQDERP